MAKSINANLRPDDRSTRGQFDLPRDGATVEQHDNDLITLWFAEAAKSYGSGKEVAFALGVDPSFVTNLKNGSKSVAGRYLVAMLRKPEAATPLLSAMVEFAGADVARALLPVVCGLAGVDPPKPRRKMKRQDVKQQLLLEIDRAPQVFELFVERIARNSGASEEEVRDAWSESTDVSSLFR